MERSAKASRASRDVFYMLGEDFVDECLVSHIAALRFLPKLGDHARVDTNRMS
jgi:hypothetical protein